MTTTIRIAIRLLTPLVFAAVLVVPVVAQDSSPTPASLRQAARDSFAIGDANQARRHLQLLTEMYRHRYAERGETASREWSQHLQEVAQEYLRGGQLADAMLRLGEATELVQSNDAGFVDEFASLAAGWHRQLTALDAEERFELLHEWSMPTDERRTVRVLTSIVPTVAPPVVFARALEERPRRDSFAIPEIGGVRGLFNSTWQLVVAADAAGRLRGLAAEAERLVEDGVSNARFLQLLIEIVESKREDAELQKALQEYLSRGANSAETLPYSDIVIASASLTRARLQPLGEQILKSKIEQTYDQTSPVMRPFLRLAHATAVRKRDPDATPGTNGMSNVELWVPTSVEEAERHAEGAVQSVWLAHEDHIMHLAGPRSDYLFFKYPLTGEFEFSCEAQLGGRGGTDGCIGYGGLGYEIWSARKLLKVWDASHGLVNERPCPFVRTNLHATFNRFSLKSTANGVSFLCNGHPMWNDDSKDTSPWVSLRSYGASAPVFRNLKITGDPVIPRQVQMLEGDSLRGWAASYYSEQLTTMDATADWSCREGIIDGAQRTADSTFGGQSRLYYVRPLLANESISYEFQYQPGQLEVHPALGRLALLIEPDGVRLHWMTDGDHEWTGLAEDNAVVEPLNRRGPKPLPLLAGEWNRVTVALDDGTLTLFLNDTMIYRHKIEPEDERTFGFYHDKKQTEARVRNLVMRGDWPERLTDEQLGNLAASAESDRTTAHKDAIHAVFGESNLAANAFEVRHRGAELDPEARYRFLADWVLPGDDHPGFRLTGAFTPTNPAPVVQHLEVQAARSTRTSDADAIIRGESGLLIGGDLVAPAFDLIEVARQIGQLDDLRGRVDRIEVQTNGYEQRAQLALLFLIDIARDDSDSAKALCAQLIDLVREGEHADVLERWPETIALARGVNCTPIRENISEFLYLLRNMYGSDVRGWRTKGSQNWDHWYFSLLGAFEYLESGSESPDRFKTAPQLKNWTPVTYMTAKSCGDGHPRPHWQVGNASIMKLGGHEQDYLHYRIPLRGNYEVECDLTFAAWRTVELMVGGTWVGPWWDGKAYVFGNFRGQQPLQQLVSQLASPKTEWSRYRAVVRDGVCTTYFNGRRLHEHTLTEGSDPWLAIRATARSNGAVRDVRISGNPIIPVEIDLAMSPELPGWLPYHEDSIGHDGDWRPLAESSTSAGILGTRRQDLAGTWKESLLRYHRPMLEDGVIEYEFYYRAGEIHVHPAIDRLAFMLQPDGVRVHWITDGRWDRTGLAPDNLHDDPDNRHGPPAMPLQSDAWNRMQVSLTGDVLSLTLNGELIYRRELESTNQRTFGLFHHAGQTESRVRHIVWKGDWPRELPAVAEQELADHETDFLEETVADLTAVFHHDFVESGLPSDLFGVTAGSIEHFSVQPDGVRVTRHGGSGHHGSSIAPQLTVHGDFDITAEFEQFAPDPGEGGSGGVFLQVFLNDAGSSECLVFRRDFWHPTEPKPIVQAAYNTRKVGGVKRDKLPDQTSEVTAGRLRLSRRGDTVYFLFAENDAPNFRLVGIQATTNDEVKSVRLMADTFQEGLTTVVWKSLTICADKLEGLALSDEKTSLAKLDQQRDELPQRLEYDFAKKELTDEDFYLWGSPVPQSEAAGARLVAPGGDEWTSVGLAPQIGLDGDFDIAATFNVLDLAKPKAGQYTGFYLQIRFPDQVQTQANLILTQQTEGPPSVTAQLANVDAGGNWVFERVRLANVDTLEVLRFARRGNKLSFIYRQQGVDRDRILAETEIVDIPIATTGIRLHLHTGGAERQSEVLLKRLRVYAEEIDPLPDEFHQ